jgi:hypothetical protein
VGGEPRPTRILKLQKVRGLVECLSSGVIASATKTCVLTKPFHQHDLSVPTRYNKGNVRRLQRWLMKLAREDVPFDVIDWKNWDISGKSESLGEGNPHQEAAFESRAARHSDPTNVS